jgi:hypothetical protein
MENILTQMEHGEGTMDQIDHLYHMCNMILGKSFCALGDAAAMPVMSYIEKFRPSSSSTSREALHGQPPARRAARARGGARVNVIQGWPPEAQWASGPGSRWLGVIGFMLGVLPVVIWGERKVAAHIQFRPARTASARSA